MNTISKATISSQISSLRLPDNYSANVGGIKLPPKPVFGKLSKHRFSRVHPGKDFQFPCLAVETKNEQLYVLNTP